MTFRIAILFLGTFLVALVFGADVSWAQHVGYAFGGCGGVMRGYDGRSYRCGADRMPVCNRNEQQCVCLALRKCGAKEDEPY